MNVSVWKVILYFAGVIVATTICVSQNSQLCSSVDVPLKHFPVPIQPPPVPAKSFLVPVKSPPEEQANLLRSSLNHPRQRRRIYVDLGANWANTLERYKIESSACGNDTSDFLEWEIYAFEASPPIGAYADAVISHRNNPASVPFPDMPLGLPVSGSTADLIQWNNKHGLCTGQDTKSGRLHECMLRHFTSKFEKSGIPSWAGYNNLTLIQERLDEALIPNFGPTARYTFVGAAAGSMTGHLKFVQRMMGLFIGGVRTSGDTRAADISDSVGRTESIVVGKYDIYVVDIVEWLKRFSLGDCIVLKMDVEGAEFNIMPAILQNKQVTRQISRLLWECHNDRGGKCRTLTEKIHKSGIPLFDNHPSHGSSH